MHDILSVIYRDDPLQYRVVVDLQSPKTLAERQISGFMTALDPDRARRLESCVDALIHEQGDLAFHRGARFGARVMAELLEE